MKTDEQTYKKLNRKDLIGRMPSVSKSAMPDTWMRRLSNARDFRYNSDGNSSSYSSVEDNQRLERQLIPSFMMNDDLSGRSYVDPWDMENYSFLRKQLEDINLSDNELSPALESAQSDFYYVPLDHSGSPQYQYKHYVDPFDFKDGFLPQSYRDDVHGLMPNIDEYDFYNEHLDTTLSMLQNDDLRIEFNNLSRQSERSRYNNQDYHTYTPPSIIKGFSETSPFTQGSKLRRRASVVTFRPDTYRDDFLSNEVFPQKNTQKNSSMLWQTRKKSLADVKIKLNRRKSFHALTETPDLKFGKMERRKSVLDHPHLEKWQMVPTEILPEVPKTKEKLDKRKSVAEISTEPKRKPVNLREGILQSPDNRGSRLRLNVSFRNEPEYERKSSRTSFSSQPDSSLVYVYETARRRRKMFLPSYTSKIFEEDDYRNSRSEIQDVFSLDPIEQYLNRPTSRYTMTNYGHLKIDYSCSWNYLDKCIAQRICL